MNERIRELAEQAYMWSVNEAKGDRNGCIVGSDYFLAMEKKKFAELIVRECLGDLKERISIRYQGSDRDRDIGYGMEIVYFDIVDKFGVE